MIKNRWSVLGLGGCVALGLSLAGCPGPVNEDDIEELASGDKSGELAALEGKITVDGSSTVQPLTSAVAEEFRKKFPNVDPIVERSGTGGGFKKFSNGETDVSNASRPITKEELAACRANGVAFVEIPIALDGLSIVVNPQNEFVEQLTIEDLKRIFLEEGGAKTWHDVNSAWPDTPLEVYAPGTDSGTYDYFFKDVVAKGGGRPRKEMSTSEDDNVLVVGVARNRAAIGFFGCAYYFENQDKLKVVKIVNPEGKPVAPTPETILSGEYAPFSRPLLIYLKEKSLDRPEMDEFVNYYLDHAAELSRRVGYVPLPDEIYERARSHFNQRLLGTHFLTADGAKRHGTLAEVYTTENLVNRE